MNKSSRRRFLQDVSLGLGAASFAGLTPVLASPVQAARGARNKPSNKRKILGKVEPLPLSHVRLLEGPFLDNMRRDEQYILSQDPDRMLHTFRINAGLPSTAQPLGGWEAPNVEVRGQSLGHYLTACSLMYAATGDERFKERVTKVVDALARCQQALPARGFNPGYLSAFPESFIDRWDRLEFVWSPWYTLHKIMAGLLDSYQLTGNRQALDVLVRMADWVKLRIDGRATEQLQKSINNEIGGVEERLANLYAITGNPSHLRLARAFDHHAIIDPLARGEDPLDGRHANTQIPKIIGAARIYELTGDETYRRIAEVFWRRVALDRSFVHGGDSDNECFFPVTDFTRHLGPETAETCNTYNMLKLTRHLFEWEPRAELMDFYERALFNHILSSQDPQKGMFVYYMTVKPGHFKTYSTPNNSFWCCVGTGMENHAKYAESIYFHANDALYVNLFIASELNWKDKGVVVRQETCFPDEDTVRLTVGCKRPVQFALKVRHPYWTDGMKIAVNGAAVGVGKPSSYTTLSRDWKHGDRIEIQLPMNLRTEPLPGNPEKMAFLYGPIVLAGEFGRAGLDRIEEYVENQREYSNLPAAEPPTLVAQNPEAVTEHIQPVAGKPLVFKTKDIGDPMDVSLIPLFRLHHQHYALYWDVLSREQLRDRRVETAAGWVKYGGNPVLGGKYSTCFDIAVLKERYVYRMWFSWRPKKSIALVQSKDGIHWSDPVIVLGPNPNIGWETDINRPAVVKANGLYHMWYSDYRPGRAVVPWPEVPAKIYFIGYATSVDGVTWKRMSDQPVLSPDQAWENVQVLCPTVLWDQHAKVFKMWYSGGDNYEPDAIGYATSRDGLTWTKHPKNPIFKGDPNGNWDYLKAMACQVVRQGDWYVMFYAGLPDIQHSQIGIARSRDGITNWQRHPGNPIIRPGKDKFDASACYKPHAIFDGKKWLLWYNGRHGTQEEPGGGPQQIGVAFHEGEDLQFK
jgi:hypothetical protein